MPPLGVVKRLDVFKHTLPGFVPRTIVIMMRALGLERVEEALHRGIIPAVTLSAHAAFDSVGLHQHMIIRRPVLRTLVGMQQQTLDPATPPQGHRERFNGQGLCGSAIHRPAHNSPGVQVHDRRQVQPAFTGRDVGNVGHPALIRLFGAEVTLELVGLDVLKRPAAPCALAQYLHAGLEPCLAHQSRDPAPTVRSTTLSELDVDTRIPIGPVTHRVDRLNLCQ